MGILDQVSGALGGGKSGGMQAILVQQLIAYLSKPNALGSLTASFQQHGLGNIVQSWLGSENNLPISPSQVQQVLGNDVVSDMASRANMSEPEAANSLSSLLPQVMDKISPDGKVPESNDLGSMLKSAGSLFG